jgi:hypothetical protein
LIATTALKATLAACRRTFGTGCALRARGAIRTGRGNLLDLRIRRVRKTPPGEPRMGGGRRALGIRGSSQ